jgi:hypothetical protein
LSMHLQHGNLGRPPPLQAWTASGQPSACDLNSPPSHPTRPCRLGQPPVSPPPATSLPAASRTSAGPWPSCRRSWRRAPRHWAPAWRVTNGSWSSGRAGASRRSQGAAAMAAASAEGRMQKATGAAAAAATAAVEWRLQAAAAAAAAADQLGGGGQAAVGRQGTAAAAAAAGSGGRMRRAWPRRCGRGWSTNCC